MHYEYWYFQVSGQQILEAADCTELHSLRLIGADYRSALQKPRRRLCYGRGNRFQAAGDNGEETEALDDVMYALHAFRSNYQNLGVS